MHQISLQIKYRAKIKTEMRASVNMRKILKKKVLIIINYNYNKVKAEQCFAVIGAKRVAVFQARLKVVREKASAKLFNNDNKH